MDNELKVPCAQEQETKLLPVREIAAAYCYNCGNALSQGQNFCANCGACAKVFLEDRIPTPVNVTRPAPVQDLAPMQDPTSVPMECPPPAVVSPTPAEVKKPTKKAEKRTHPFLVNVIRSSLVLAMAIIMAIVSFFPLLKTEVEYNYDTKVYVTFGMLDGILMQANLCDSLEEGELFKLSNKLKGEYEEYYEDWQKGKELEQLSKFTKEIVNLYLRAEDTQATPGTVLVAILSAAQLLLLVFLLIFAVIGFIGVFVKGVSQFPLLSLLLLGLSAALLFLMAVAMDLSYGISTMITDSVTTKLTAVPILACILFVILAVAFMILELTLNRQRIKSGEIVKRSLCVAFAVVLLFAAFAPIATTEIKTRFKNVPADKTVNATVDASVYAHLTLSEKDREQFEKWDNDELFDAKARTYFKSFSLYTKREVETGVAEFVNETMYSYLLLGYGMYESTAVFGMGTVLTILVMLCALFIICQNLAELATGRGMGNAMLLTVKIAAVIMALLLLILTIVMVVNINDNAKRVPLPYEAGVAYGTFLMLLGAVGTLSTPGVKRTK